MKLTPDPCPQFGYDDCLLHDHSLELCWRDGMPPGALVTTSNPLKKAA